MLNVNDILEYVDNVLVPDLLLNLAVTLDALYSSKQVRIDIIHK